jgi:leucyl-tRNA---protein transferase
MKPLFTFVTPGSPCAYRPGESSQLRYDIVGECTPAEYSARMLAGWRRFGYSLFKPECPACTLCLSLRVNVNQFRPNESQRRAWKANNNTDLTITVPSADEETLALYDRFHAFQADFKNWPRHAPKDADEYAESFVYHPFPTQEWQYRVEGQLMGVGYVDVLPAGLSAMYFYYDPAFRPRSPGTYNVLRLLEQSRRRGDDYLYLGYYVEGCRSLEYKANFRPNEILTGGQWQPLRT